MIEFLRSNRFDILLAAIGATWMFGFGKLVF
jgi:hypothetical protein